jgi:N-acetylglucosamine kinase-like BadF-type ATPase
VSAPDGPIVVGVDGGNTKTLALVATGRGEVLGTGRAGCADIYNAASPDIALGEVARAVTAALDEAGVDAAAVDSAAFSLAGADWPEDMALLHRELPARNGLRGKVDVVNDAMGALRSGSPDWTGIAIVCGTWGAIGARHPDGTIFHLGFWPDGAGARQLGRDALRAVYRTELGLDPATQLTDRALARFGAPSVLELLHDFTRRGGRAEAEEGLLAVDVLDAADAGDAVALGLVEGQARVVSAQARVSAGRVGLELDGTTVVLTGGLLNHGSPLLGDLTMALLPGAVRALPVHPPVVGAALLAFDRVGVTADAATVRAGLPDHLWERSDAWAASSSRR